MFLPISLHVIYSPKSFGEKHEREDATTRKNTREKSDAHEDRTGSNSHVKNETDLKRAEACFRKAVSEGLFWKGCVSSLCERAVL